MADRKKNGTRAQTATLKNREKRVSTTEEEIGSTPAPARTDKSVSAGTEGIKSTPTPARTEKSVSVSKEGLSSTPAPARMDKRVSASKEGIKSTPAPAARVDKSTKVASTREAKRETVRRDPAKQETKTSTRRDAKAAPSTFTRLRNSKTGRFIYDAYYELRYKVNWPTFEEARTMAILVIIISAVLGLLIFGVDTGLNRLFLLITTGK
jgi:preprotein translocase subunit SecE